jgi:hypothetical protein
MKKLLVLAAVVLLASQMTGCGVIHTGDVGMRTQFGQVSSEPVPVGFYTAILSSVDEYTAKETFVALNGLKPRAHDNLTLKDLDVTVYYRMEPAKIPSFAMTHSGMSAKFDNDAFTRPGYILLSNVAQGVISDEVSKLDSLTLHQNRQTLEANIKKSLQTTLDGSDKGYFDVTRVIVQAIQTDPAIEASIQKSIQAGKDLEAATKQVSVKEQLAYANEKLAQSLTPAYLQHEYIEALKDCATSKSCTMIIDGSKGGALVNLQATK